MNRPAVTPEQLELFLREGYADLTDVTTLQRGNHSVTVSFVSCTDPLIARVGKDPVAYERDALVYAWAQGHPAINAPQVIERGEFPGGLFYAVSRRADGTHHDGTPYPSVLNALDAIHNLDISHTSGYGTFDARGHAAHRTWELALSATIAPAQESRCEQNWWSPQPGRQAADALAGLLAVPLGAPRSLLHGDFGFYNLLMNDEDVSAVIDWGLAQFGDPLYDLARLAFWAPMGTRRDAAGLWTERHDVKLASVIRRLRACELAVCCSMLAYAARNADRGCYDWSVTAAQELLDD